MSQKLTYVATSNVRPDPNIDSSVAVMTWDRRSRTWQDNIPEVQWFDIHSISKFRQAVKTDMPGCRVFRIGI